jgi:hypothetical protein
VKYYLQLLGAALGICALSSEKSAPAGTPENAAIASSAPVWVIGDSIGVGIAAALRRAGVPVVEKARNNTTARQWRAWMADTKGERWPMSPRVVVISLGTNDSASADLLSEFRANAKAIMWSMRARGHRVIWVLPPSGSSRIPRGSDLEFLLALGGEWLLERELPMGDLWHPSVAGYDRLAERVQKLRGKTP